MTKEPTTTPTPKLPKRIRYAADNKNYACIDDSCKAHHDAEYVRLSDILSLIGKKADEWRQQAPDVDENAYIAGRMNGQADAACELQKEIEKL